LSGQIINLGSVLIALAAVCVAAWQIRSSVQGAKKANALPVISEIFNQWRSLDFNASLRRLIDARFEELAVPGFESLPRKLRQDAYEVCYFFDYLGTLAAHKIMNEDIIIGVMGTRLAQMWEIMSDLIRRERACRAHSLPQSVPPGFLVYYEHLAKRINDLGGKEAARRVQRRIGVESFGMQFITGSNRLESDSMCSGYLFLG
jgi:hypothetical protein